MARSEHIRVKRAAYWHHGIDCGDGTVIHYTGERQEKQDAVVRRTTCEEFANGGMIEVVHYKKCDSSDTVIARAESRLGENEFQLLFNNCEHFARWCKTGKHHSRQVARALQIAGVVAMAAGTVVGALLARRGRKRVS